MCNTCGCNLTDGNRHLVQADGPLAHTDSGAESVTVLKSLLAANDHAATHNREHFDRHGVLVINLMSSPGAGKTSLLEKTLATLAERWRIAVIEGDLETERDAERIRQYNIPVIQITTGTACHLDAHQVHTAVHKLNLDEIDLLFIENVGNLVCPASFDLGQHRNVTLLSIPEGDDKPAKYPVMFRAADLMIISKQDLCPVLPEFDVTRATDCFRQLANPAPILQLSAKTGTGMPAWADWLADEMQARCARVAAGSTLRPGIQTTDAALHVSHAVAPETS